MSWTIKELGASGIQRKKKHGFDTSSYGKEQSIQYFQEKLKRPKINLKQSMYTQSPTKQTSDL